jgi:hypothetical protein
MRRLRSENSTLLLSVRADLLVSDPPAIGGTLISAEIGRFIFLSSDLRTRVR